MGLIDLKASIYNQPVEGRGGGVGGGSLLTNPKSSANIRIMIPRLIEDLVLYKLSTSGKIIILLGARQVGKTTLIRDYIKQKLITSNKKVLYLNCDIEEEKKALNLPSIATLEKLVAGIDVLLIDEVQNLENPGLTLKVIHDNFLQVKVLATGSSSFDLKNRLSDPLTGRYIDFTLYPFSFIEVLKSKDPSLSPAIIKNRADSLLSGVLLYGLYPEVYLTNSPQDKVMLLNKLIESYLFKDVLAFQRIRNAQAIRDLTRAIAYQIGSEVNENELANRLKIDRKTIVSYLDILEKAFVIVKVWPFSKNPRREIGKNYKIFFVDLGIRNALIGDFNPVDLRSDVGSLWENFLFIERMKTIANAGEIVSRFFWRSYSGAEVDYIEKTISAPIKAYEFKYRGGVLSKGARSFSKQYNTVVELKNMQNYLDFVSSSKP